MTIHESTHEITQDVVIAALENANGWVYKIEGNFGSTEYVPPEAVVGAWKVSSTGIITGEFIPNPKYKASNVESS
mgnify:CR=1 FL=1